MLEHIVENSKKSLTELFHPSTLFEWLFLLIMIGCFCFTIALLYAWIHETIHEKKKKSKYPSLLKKYYRQYGDYVFETEEFVEEINLLYDNKAPQEIRFDLKDASAKVGDSKNKCKKGVWLVVVKNDMKIHPLNKEVIISHIRINGNTISFLERVKDRYRTYSSYREQRIQANRWTYSVDISRYQVSDSADDDIWKDCLRYNVGKNTMLKILVKAMTDCYNISSCFLTDDKAKYACKQCMNQLNPLLQPYHMRTEMTQESWQFYYNDAPITLEEVIKKLPDDVLSKELNKSDPKSPKAFNQDTPSIAQSQSIFQEKLPYISEDEYIAQLEELYRKFGNNAFHYIMSVQNRTGYSKEKIKTDLKNIRSKVDAMSPPKYSQSKSSQYYPRVVQKPLPEEEYITKLENLYRKFGDNAFQHLSEIQKQTGFNRKKVEIDLSEVRHRLWLNAELSKEQPQSKPRQPSLRTAQEVSTPPQSQPRASTPTPSQQAPTPPPKAPSKPKLSIEEELLNYLKTQPICWEFPLTTQDKALNKFCEALVFSDNVASVSSNEAIRELELTIQKKRARNPRLADHNAAMEGNILAMLYEYSYLMHIFHALDDMKFDTTKVDIQKLWLLIQKDCNARINNLAEEKRKNPTIQIVLDKYNYDHQITQLKVLKDATGREMDYIISFIMAYSLLTVISLLFSNPQLLQPLKPYSADDIAGMMNALVNASAGLRFTAYSR